MHILYKENHITSLPMKGTYIVIYLLRRATIASTIFYTKILSNIRTMSYSIPCRRIHDLFMMECYFSHSVGDFILFIEKKRKRKKKDSKFIYLNFIILYRCQEERTFLHPSFQMTSQKSVFCQNRRSMITNTTIIKKSYFCILANHLISSTKTSSEGSIQIGLEHNPLQA